MALSLTYLNEGHVPDHRRDGLTPQFWGRYLLIDRRLSLTAGIGPYLFFARDAAKKNYLHNTLNNKKWRKNHG